MNKAIKEKLDNKLKKQKEQEIVKEQERFIEFLKYHNLYNPMIDANTMKSMHKIWKILSDEIEQIYEDMAGESI